MPGSKTNSNSKKTQNKMEHNIHRHCASITKHLNEQEPCENVLTTCYKSKCLNEGNNIIKSSLTKEQINKCIKDNKTPQDTKQCMDDIKEKSNFNNNIAMYSNCVAVKCPEVYTMKKTISDTKNKEMLAKQNIHTHSKTHHNDTNEEKTLDAQICTQIKCYAGIDDKINECNKKFNTFDEQTKCMEKTLKKQKTCNSKCLSNMITKILK